jgi:hypothetical protein
MQTAYDGNAIFFSVAVPLDGCILGHYDLTSGGGSNSNGWLYMAESGYGGGAFGSDITINSARKNGSAYSTTGANADDIYTDFVGQNLLYTSLSTASQNLNFGYRPGPSVFPMWSMQEFIIYPDTSTHTPGDIETDINSEYLIYQPTDAPTSGLLATYTGAAAAYSVRQLADTAVIAITVRRDSDDEEQRFGFDSNGDLDTTGIADFCTTANGYVSQWWDQSTNGNHATQSTSGNQPQIYNGTAVITENGKTAVYQNGSTYFNNTTLTSSVNQNNMAQFAAGRLASASPAYGGLFSLLTLTEDEGMALAYRADQYIYNDAVLGSHGSNDFTQRLWSGYADNASSDVKFYRDGVQQVSTTPSSQTHDNLAVGSLGHTVAATRWNGYIQEVILFGVSTKADHSDIESDINTYFSIY